jgi:regulatory protein
MMPPITSLCAQTVFLRETREWLRGRSTDNQAPGAGSSSPSAKEGPGGERLSEVAHESLEVLSVQLTGAAGEMVRIHLSDGSSFVLHAEVFARVSICSGSILDSETRARLLVRSELVSARLQALKLLGRSAHTRRGLARKLAARGFGRSAIAHALARMSELGYLDDRAFAESWMHLHLSSGRDGGVALFRGLLSRGVTRAVAEEVLADMYPFEEEVRNAHRLTEGLSRNAVIRRLTGRGFRARTIAAVLREITGTTREPRAD